ncbi:NAD(P)/FAD-dependent oxidoreductase [Litoribacillus peritrichatus]|uniref:Protein CbrA n=1 Tax=Litoribacillus peritrichatus TaxID=718191 RepID=A0ABP7ME30_9GAMM
MKLTASPSDINVAAVIVGASIAGCCTALKLAEKGIKVAIIEKQPDQADDKPFKKMCSHLIHPPGVKTLADFGLLTSLYEKGAQATYLDIESEGNHIHYPFGQKADAANIERRLLDPALRQLTEQHPNITLYSGYRIQALNRSGKTITGLLAVSNKGEHINFNCPLVIGADGRKSKVAKLDHCQDKTIPNRRVALFSYFKTDTNLIQSTVWALNKGEAYVACFPNSNKLLLSCYIPESHFQEIKHDAQSFYQKYVVNHVQQYGFQVGEQVGELFIAKDTATLYRAPNSKGLAFVGDAFVAADPLTGIGCSWAMSSAELLANQVAPSLRQFVPEKHFQIKKIKPLDRAIQRYNRYHKLKFLLPAYLMAWLSLKGHWVFNRRIYGWMARFLGTGVALGNTSQQDEKSTQKITSNELN